MNYFEENLILLSEKFPLLYFFIKTHKIKKNKKFEENKQKINFENIDSLYVYKLALNDSLNKWIENKRLIFIEDDLDTFCLFFQTKKANRFLKSKNVYFYFLNDMDQFLNETANSFISKNINVITFEKANEKFKNLKQKIFKKALISYLSHFNQIYSCKLYKNYYRNLEKVKDSFYANNLKDKFKNVAAIICGAGPSLKYSFETLKKLENKALILAGGSAISCLTKEGINPHIGIVIDPNLDEFKRTKEALSFEAPIIYSLRVNSGVFNTFNGDLGYVKAAIAGWGEIFLDETLNIKDEYISKCFDEKSITVTSLAIVYAKLLGCNPIILDGVDLAYSENKRYASNIIKKNYFDENSEDFEVKPILTKCKNDKKIYSSLKWQIENEGLTSLIENFPDVKFYNATKSGLNIENIENTSLKELEKTYFKKEIDLKALVHSLIQNSKLENFNSKNIKALKESLKNSFVKSRNFVREINNNKNPEYKKILSKIELEDEIAYKYFLFDILDILEKHFPLENKWKSLEDSLKYFFVNM